MQRVHDDVRRLRTVRLDPDRAYSPASIAKAYLDAMGVAPPLQKFKVPNKILGIDMEAYYGGRCETRLRLTEVPVVPTDFTSNYPTVNALLGNWDVLTAKSVSFEDVSNEIRAWLPTVTLNELFDREVWRKLSFFAHVRPNEDLLPVRTVYNGETKNLGLNHLTSDKPIWIAGPDLMVAVLLGKKVPHIIEALRMVNHGKQKGLKRISLRGMVDVATHVAMISSVIASSNDISRRRPTRHFLASSRHSETRAATGFLWR